MADEKQENTEIIESMDVDDMPTERGEAGKAIGGKVGEKAGGAAG